ncbi:MAG: Ig-like domain-containing protein, partial [Candidatus Methanofastidiosia archaeon]
SGQIEANDCLAEAYVMDSNNGAIAAIYNDNYGWFSTLDACMYSGEFCINEFRASWSDGKQKFGDMLNQARSYLVSSAQSNTTYRWCFYERNLVGDPETPFLTKTPPPVDSVTITNPANGANVCGTVNITTSSTGCIDTVEFYIDEILEYTDTSAPFEYSWDTILYSVGNHTILVKGYCSDVYKDSDSVFVDVFNIPPCVAITNPQNGATVSGTVLITTATVCIDEVRFYIDETLKYTDTTAPFEYKWKTKKSGEGSHTIRAEGYYSGVFVDYDQITVNVAKKASIALLSFLVLLLPFGIVVKRH